MEPLCCSWSTHFESLTKIILADDNFVLLANQQRTTHLSSGRTANIFHSFLSLGCQTFLNKQTAKLLRRSGKMNKYYYDYCMCNNTLMKHEFFCRRNNG